MFENFRRRIILLAAMAIFSASCSSLDSLSDSKVIEGWRTSEDGSVDIFYMKLVAHASENALEKENQAMMQTSCIESTKIQAADTIIRKMIGETVEGQSGMLDGHTTGIIVNSIRSGNIKGIETKECAPRGKDGSWADCECIHFVQGKGLKKKIQLEVTKIDQGG